MIALVPLTLVYADITDAGIYPPENYNTFVPPVLGGTYVDPVFGTTIKRVSNAPLTPRVDTGGPLTFITTEYSSMSAFNQDSSKFVALHQAYFALYDFAGTFIRNLPLEINASREPRWCRKNPDILFYVVGNQLKQYNVATDTISVIRIFSEYSSITGKGESEMSLDGNHMVFAGDNRHVFVYQIGTNTKFPSFDTGGRAFDSIYITPSNNVTITWIQAGTNRYNGIELFDRNMNFQRQVARAGGHMAVTRDSDGEDVLVWVNAADPAPVCNNGIVKIRLSDGNQTCLLSLDWSLAVHISTTQNNGWAFVNTYAPSEPSPTSNWKSYTNEIIMVKLDGSQTRRLLHHRSRRLNSYNYTPRVSVSRDGTKFIYSSNYNLQSILGLATEYSDVYLVSVPGASAPAPAPSPEPSPSPSPSPTTPATRFEETANDVAFSGSWHSSSLSVHSGGSARLSMESGSRATFTFTGTRVSWVGYRDEWSGIARVYVDGALRETVDTYSSPGQAQQALYTISGLTNATHSLEIEVTGTRNSVSRGSWVWVDAFDVDTSASAEPAPVPEPEPTPTVTRLEESDASIQYTGSWLPNHLGGHSGNSAVLSMEKGARATVRFNGTGISWIAYRDEWAGKARVFINGKQSSANLDLYASPSSAQAVVYKVSGLSRGTHTLTIEVRGDKRQASGGSWVWVDAFDVQP